MGLWQFIPPPGGPRVVTRYALALGSGCGVRSGVPAVR